MWNEILVALALVMVFEGLLPFLKPDAMRRAWISMAAMDDRSLRVTGFVSMLIGVFLLYLVR